MHVPWVQTPGVRHSFTSVGEKPKLASYPLHSLQHQAESVSIKRPGTSIPRGPSTLRRTKDIPAPGPIYLGWVPFPRQTNFHP